MERILVLIISIGCALAISSCGQKNYIKTGSTDVVPTQNQERTIVIRDYSDNPTSRPGITASIKTYKDKNISIQYPVLSYLSDAKKEEEVNALLKSNALKVLQVNAADPLKDTVIIDARIVSTDSKRITVVYTGTCYSEGAAHPLNMFYTNTVDLTQVKDLGLTDYADPEVLAEYILSDQVDFYDASAELVVALKEARTQTDLQTYAKIFQQADFPLKASLPDGTPAFPDSFSYEDNGRIIFSIPVPHALGDYALVSYSPVTK